MHVPSEDDWGPADPDDPDNLDQAYARRVFLGKTAADAWGLFRENVLMRAEDLRFMPTRPFQFYMLAFRDYVLSPAVFEEEVEAASAADTFLGLLLSRLREQPSTIVPILPELWSALETVALNQLRYSADADIYGDLRARLAEIKALAGP